LKAKIEKHIPSHIKLLSQGEIVAESLEDYLQRHPEIETTLTKEANRLFYTTDAAEDFSSKASLFFADNVAANHIDL
jgi:glutamate racemase